MILNKYKILLHDLANKMNVKEPHRQLLNFDRKDAVASADNEISKSSNDFVVKI